MIYLRPNHGVLSKLKEAFVGLSQPPVAMLTQAWKRVPLEIHTFESCVERHENILSWASQNKTLTWCRHERDFQLKYMSLKVLESITEKRQKTCPRTQINRSRCEYYQTAVRLCSSTITVKQQLLKKAVPSRLSSGSCWKYTPAKTNINKHFFKP